MSAYNDTIFPTGDILDIKSTWSFKSNSTYLIKIEEDYKIITDCFLDKQKLEKVIRTYYPEFTIEIFPIQSSTPTLINLLTQTNSFLKTNEITPEELQSKLKQWDEVINYFNKYSDSKINEMFKQTTNKINEEKNKYVELRIGDNTRLQVNSTWDEKNSNDNCFEASGDYINTKELSQIISYENNSRDFMEINNFNVSLLETPIQIFNVYFNNQFNNIFIISQTEDFIFHNNKINNLFPEINLLISIELENEKLETIKELNKDIFVNYEDAKSRINRLLNDKVIDSKLSIDEIKGLINKYFTINTNPSDCIKFTNILTTISSEIKVSESYVNYFKRQLPNILTDLGLQKKRLSDGIYWYGLVVRNNNEIKPTKKSFSNTKISEKPVTDDDFKNYMEQRKIKYVDSEKNTKPKDTSLLKQVEPIVKNEQEDNKSTSVQLNVNEEINIKEENKNDAENQILTQSVKNVTTKKTVKQSESIESTNNEPVNLQSKTNKIKSKKQKLVEDSSQPPSPEISKVIKKKPNKSGNKLDL